MAQLNGVLKGLTTAVGGQAQSSGSMTKGQNLSFLETTKLEAIIQ